MADETYRITTDAPGFAPAPCALYDDERITDPTTLAVYGALARFIDYGTATCFPSLATIGKKARCSADTAARHVDLLAELGYLQKRRTGRSSIYHLVDPWGRRSGTGAVSDTAPMPVKRDSINEKGEGEPSAAAVVGASQPRQSLATAAPPPILELIRQEAASRGKGTAWIDRGWEARFSRLLSEVRECDVLPAFRTCLTCGGNPYYFPADFAKWHGKSTSTTAVTARPQHKLDAAALCPMCKQPMMAAEGDWVCLPCHERFDSHLKHVPVVTAEELHQATEKFRVPAYAF